MGGRPSFRRAGGGISSCRVGSRRGIQLPVSEDEGCEGMEGKVRVEDWIVVMGHNGEVVCEVKETINSWHLQFVTQQ